MARAIHNKREGIAMIMSTTLNDAALIPLTSSTANTVTVKKISGPEQRRLCELGFVEGATIDIVNRARRDMIVVKVGGAKLALSRGIADSVWVK